MTDHFQNIYQNHADQYELLISREDYQHNLLPALQAIRPLDGLDVVELGAGTGRVTRLLAPQVKTIHAFDAAQPMLDVAAAKLTELGFDNWSVQQAEHKSLPVEDNSADLVVAGWTFGHIPTWYPERWQDELDLILTEIKRVLRPDGTILIIETMGTGFEDPRPPTDRLAAYYAHLEQDLGFAATTIRTDYRFTSLEEAEQLSRFFFGEWLSQQVVDNEWLILPECTGLWWLQL